MTRNGRTKVIYKGTFISIQTLVSWLGLFYSKTALPALTTIWRRSNLNISSRYRSLYNRWIRQRYCQSKEIWHNFWWQHPYIVWDSIPSILPSNPCQFLAIQRLGYAPKVYETRPSIWLENTTWIWME